MKYILGGIRIKFVSVVKPIITMDSSFDNLGINLNWLLEKCFANNIKELNSLYGVSVSPFFFW